MNSISWTSALDAIDHYLPSRPCSCPYCQAFARTKIVSGRSSKKAGKPMKTPKDILRRKLWNDFSDCEWRFFDCPEDERHWCDIYEHSRNNEEVVEAVAEYREHRCWGYPDMFPSPGHLHIGSQFFDAFPEFPKVPFLALEGQARRIRCAQLTTERQQMRVRHLCAKQPAVVSSGMQLWEVRADITKEEQDRIGRESGVKIGRRRVSADRLKDLSILQLYRYRKPWENVVSYLDDVRPRLFSKGVSPLCNAGKRAVADIQTVLNRIL